VAFETRRIATPAGGTAVPPLDRVLVVEDDDLTASIVVAAINDGARLEDERARFVADRVATLAHAREALRQTAYAAVLLDLHLPDSDGLDALRVLLDDGASSAIIVFTARDDSATALEALHLGAQDYLFKGRVDATLILRSLLYSVNRHRAEAQLRRAHQMEALGRLAGSVAHDFNNLLTIVIGNAEALERGLIPPAEVHAAISEVREAAQRAAQLTQRLLAVGRQQQLRPAVVDLAGVVRDLEPVLRRLVGSHVTLSVVAEPGLGHVRVDPTQVEQLLLNLVLNAREAVPSGGRVDIAVGPVEPRDDAHWHPRPRPGRYLGLSVRDDGSGIAPEVLARLYDPFVSTKAAGPGSGLGLSIVFGIVQQSEGAIRCETALGRGTTFTVAFPMASIEVPAPAPVPDPHLPAGGEVILLVDDEALVRALTRRVLERHGYIVIEAATGEQALARFDADGPDVDLVLTDIVMPGLRGPELVQELERRRPGLPILFMSGYADDELMRRGALPERARLLKKPFTQDELLSEVRDRLVAGGRAPATA
jgi:signal transduction histidine kinase